MYRAFTSPRNYAANRETETNVIISAFKEFAIWYRKFLTIVGESSP